MTIRRQVYKCGICGNTVEVLFAGGGQLVCCGQPMNLQEENAVDAAVEKHVPVIEKLANGYKVSVGSIPHPMEESHYISWIELVTADGVCRRDLKPGDAPEAVFETGAEPVNAREFCTVHGLWKSS